MTDVEVETDGNTPVVTGDILVPSQQIEQLFTAPHTCLVAPKIIVNDDGSEYAFIVVKNIGYGGSTFDISVLRLEGNSGFNVTKEPVWSYRPLGIGNCFLATRLEVGSELRSLGRELVVGTIVAGVLEESFESANTLLERYNGIVKNIREGNFDILE